VFNISSSPMFDKGELEVIKRDVTPILNEKIPELIRFFDKRGLTMPKSVDRVYVIDKARRMLGYHPQFNIQEMLQSLTSA